MRIHDFISNGKPEKTFRWEPALVQKMTVDLDVCEVRGKE